MAETYVVVGLQPFGMQAYNQTLAKEYVPALHGWIYTDRRMAEDEKKRAEMKGWKRVRVVTVPSEWGAA